MIDPQKISEDIIRLLERERVDFKLFSHRAALTYEDLLAVQKETRFFGTEGKCMVMKADDQFIVYITIQGKKLNFDWIKEVLQSKKVRLATKEELKEYFGAEPGCAYPFGFDAGVPIYIDPVIFEQEWLLFSPAVPTKTIQARGADLRKVFQKLANSVRKVTDFNAP